MLYSSDVYKSSNYLRHGQRLYLALLELCCVVL